jgi:predicted RNA polymerase sigma factor
MFVLHALYTSVPPGRKNFDPVVDIGRSAATGRRGSSDTAFVMTEKLVSEKRLDAPITLTYITVMVLGMRYSMSAKLTLLHPLSPSAQIPI